jgi:glycosyltransferase involved in cell wall biosynthesis
MEPKITIGIPCYNESKRVISSIINNIEAIKMTGHSYEIVVVDDGSTDDSVALVNNLIKENPKWPITLKTNDRNRGLAYSFVECALIGKGEYFRLSCGDDPQPKEALYDVFKHIGRCDLVVPYMTSFGPRGWERHLISKVFTCIVNFLSGYRIRYYNGAPIYRRLDILRWHPSSYGFGFAADMITRLLDYEGITFIQVPTWSEEKKRKSSSALTLRNLLSVSHSILEISFRRIRRILYGRESKTPKEIRN